MKGLELLLLQDVPKLGAKGNIVKVKNGYGRNFLLPKGLATIVTKENLRRMEVEKKKMVQMELARKEEIKRIAKEMEVIACTIEAKANEDGHLFGSITYTIIAEHFEKMGFEAKAENIELEDASLYPIKELGIYPIQVRLHPEVVAKSKVWVVSEQSQ